MVAGGPKVVPSPSCPCEWWPGSREPVPRLRAARRPQMEPRSLLTDRPGLGPRDNMEKAQGIDSTLKAAHSSHCLQVG